MQADIVSFGIMFRASEGKHSITHPSHPRNILPHAFNHLDEHTQTRIMLIRAVAQSGSCHEEQVQADNDSPVPPTKDVAPRLSVLKVAALHCKDLLLEALEAVFELCSCGHVQKRNKVIEQCEHKQNSAFELRTSTLTYIQAKQEKDRKKQCVCYRIVVESL